MKKLDAQINGLILKLLNKMYPDGLTVKFIEALLYDWGIFMTDEQILKKNISYLMSKGYIECQEIDLPAPIERVQKVKITPKGKALLEGEFIDQNVNLEL